MKTIKGQGSSLIDFESIYFKICTSTRKRRPRRYFNTIIAEILPNFAAFLDVLLYSNLDVLGVQQKKNKTNLNRGAFHLDVVKCRF